MPEPKEFKGKNGLFPRNAFNARKYFNDNAYTIQDDRPIDTSVEPVANNEKGLFRTIDNKETLLYGLVDTNFVTIQPKAEFLSTGKNQDGSIYEGLDFVLEAFQNFKKAYSKGIFKQRSSRETSTGPLAAMQVSKGRINTITFLNSNIDLISKEFIISVQNLNKLSNIITFEDFVKEFMAFLLVRANNNIINYSSFITSNINDLNFSGLSLDIAEISYSKDEDKINLINNPNFQYYKETAEAFGFMINKHYPFKLTANLNSPQMRNSMCFCSQNYKTSLNVNNVEDILKNYFEYPFQDDTNYLFNLIQISYNNFARQFPRQVNVKVVDGCFQKMQYFRNLITPDQASLILTENQLISLYIKIKNIESKILYPDKNIDQITKNALEFRTKFDLAETLLYINKKFALPAFGLTSNASKVYYDTIQGANQDHIRLNSQHNRFRIF